MSPSMKAGDVGIEGTGEAIDLSEAVVQSEGEQIALPPIPEGAIEYNQLNSVKEDSGAELAGPAQSTFKVSDIDDKSDEIDPGTLDNLQGLITTDPMPTPADPKKIHGPLVQQALDDLDHEGGVTKVASNEAAPLITELPPEMVEKTEAIRNLEDIFGRAPRLKEDYNAPIQNGLVDNEVEGGIVAPKSTGFVPTDGDHSKEGFQNKSVEESEVKDKYRLYGFTVQYKESDKTITRNVSDFFDSKELAMFSLNGGRYLMPGSDKMRLTDIVSGSPLLSFNDQGIAKYHNSEWKR